MVIEIFNATAQIFTIGLNIPLKTRHRLVDSTEFGVRALGLSAQLLIVRLLVRFSN